MNCNKCCSNKLFGRFSIVLMFISTIHSYKYAHSIFFIRIQTRSIVFTVHHCVLIGIPMERLFDGLHGPSATIRNYRSWPSLATGEGALSSSETAVRRCDGRAKRTGRHVFAGRSGFFLLFFKRSTPPRFFHDTRTTGFLGRRTVPPGATLALAPWPLGTGHANVPVYATV